MVKVSIIVPVYNEQNYINKCVDAILHQTFPDFELIIIDDGSTDKTSKIIKSFQDRRIKYIRNPSNLGVAKCINIAIEQAKGEYIFVTGADCTPLKNWVQSGLNLITENKRNRNKEIVAVEGKTYYATARTSISDRILEVLEGGQYYGCNMSYKRKFLEKVGGMNPEFDLAQEDRDLAFRIRKYGDILFSEDMIVIHQRKRHSGKSLFSDAKRIKNMVHFIKVHHDYTNANLFWRILYPRKFVVLICPFLIIFYHGIRGWQDMKTAFLMYIADWYMRILIWKAAVKERVFII